MESTSMDVVYGHVSHLPPSTLKQARWKTMSGLEMSGYINVKVPIRERKFGSWKTWRSQWCMITRTVNSVILKVGNDKRNTIFSVSINEDAELCRTESRKQMYAFGIFHANKKYKEAYLYLAGESEADTQKWMSNIRNLMKPRLHSVGDDEFEISLIDNKHSRDASLAGLYGNLSVTPLEIVIRDSNTDKIKVTWHWSQISHSYLPLPPNPEDVHRICTICTSSKFKNGEGELKIFCMQADKLHEKLTKCTRFANIPKIVTQPLPPTPEPTSTPPRSLVNASASSNSLATPPHPMLLASRRMSRSENDLQTIFFGRTLNNLREKAGSQDFLVLSSNENVAYMKKVPSLIFAKVKFITSTPGCSIPGSMNELYLSHDNKQTNESIKHFEYDMIDEEKLNEDSDNVKKSGPTTSLDSGEYEELSSQDSGRRSINDIPPPLPPRKSNNSPSSELGSNLRSDYEYLHNMTNTNFDHKYVHKVNNLNQKNKILVSDPVPI